MKYKVHEVRLKILEALGWVSDEGKTKLPKDHRLNVSFDKQGRRWKADNRDVKGVVTISITINPTKIRSDNALHDMIQEMIKAGI